MSSHERTLVSILLVVTVIGGGLVPVVGATTPAIHGTESTASSQASLHGTPIYQQNTTVGGNNTNASINFPDQNLKKMNNDTLVVKSVRMPSPGFIVIHSDSFYQLGARETVMGISRRLSAGTHHNVKINASSTVPGTQNFSNYTQGLYISRMYPDRNGNGKLDYFVNGTDKPYPLSIRLRNINARNPYLDNASVSYKGSYVRRVQSGAYQKPNLTVSGQAFNYSDPTITVDSVTLPDNGYVTVYNSHYLPPDNQTLQSVIGASKHLSNGTHRNVTIHLYNGSGIRAQKPRLANNEQIKVVVSPAQETNGNEKFNYVSSGGTNDVPYTRNGTILTKTVTLTVDVPNSGSTTNATSRPASNATKSVSTNNAPSATATQNASHGRASGQSQQKELAATLLDLLSPSLIIVLLVALVALALIVGRLWRRRGNDAGRIR